MIMHTEPSTLAAAYQLLECPNCRGGGLRLDEVAKALLCDTCLEQFPESDGIACFLRTSDEYTENYDQICADDLREPKTPDIVKRIFTDLVAERVRGKTCDLGCGDGHVLLRLEAPMKVAVDIAMAYLERLPTSILRLWSHVENVPLSSGSMDTIVCTDVIEHVLDASALAAEIDRLLAPDGQLLLAFPFEQDLGVYDLPEYKARFGKYKFVHLRTLSDYSIAGLFPGFEIRFSRLITEGMPLMMFKPYAIKFMQMVRRRGAGC